MGCASSKNTKRCRHCQAPYSPVHRSYSMNNVPRGSRHPKDREVHHSVSLKSSTLGSLKLDPHRDDAVHPEEESVGIGRGIVDDPKVSNGDSEEPFRRRLTEAKTWSHMIEERIHKPAPKTPVETPPGEPETINAWELMEGLEDVTPFRTPHHIRSFSFNVSRSPDRDRDHDHDNTTFEMPKSRFQETRTIEADPPKQEPTSMWFQMNEDDAPKSTSSVSEFDPEIPSIFRSSLEKLSPSHPFHLRPLAFSSQEKLPSFESEQPSRKDRVIVYFTSLRGVRKTYEECCYVRVILKGTGVRIDERDLSMHSGFKEELKELLGEALSPGSGYGLPRVFMGKKYIGGAEEIRRMHEDGKLEKLLEGCEREADGYEGRGYACEACGDIRFVPCETCSGSCKVFYGDDYEDYEEEEEQQQQYELEEGQYGFQRCPDCNENGLIRCSICFD